MVLGLGRGGVGRFAAVRVWLVWLSCGLSAAGWTQAIWAQSGTDGAIGGRVLSAAGRPVAGALVVVQGLETGLAMRARSGSALWDMISRIFDAVRVRTDF